MRQSGRDRDFQIIRSRLASSCTLTVLTGAGISADSGIPTFRGREGLWKQFKPEDLATPQAFSNDPRLVWEWYNWRRGLIASKSPNAGHYVIAEMEKQVSRFHLVTQNVDGLHERAGSTNPIELHGNIWKVRCTHCHRISFNFETPLRILPTCAECGGLLRPHIVWFGEQLEEEVLEKTAAVLRQTDLMMIIGTSGIVHPAASFAGLAKSRGAFLVEINPERTPMSQEMDITLRGKGMEILPLLLA
jgi:NAD-dependent deacetylase